MPCDKMIQDDSPFAGKKKLNHLHVDRKLVVLALLLPGHFNCPGNFLHHPGRIWEASNVVITFVQHTVVFSVQVV